MKKIAKDGTVKCEYCGGRANIISRVTGYFSTSNMWNKGKLAELRDRFKNKFYERN
jgi:anaerobic ribonucleoside-triphosphate reductase